LRGEGLALGLREHLGRQQALIRRASSIVALAALAADAVPAQELAERAEEVELQPQEAVEALQEGEGAPGGIAIAPDEAADREPVPEFDPRLVVLAIRPAPREADALAAAIRNEAPIHKLGAVVVVPLAQRDRQAPADPLDSRTDADVPKAPDSFEFRPARRDINADEAREVEAVEGLPAVQDEIALDRARPRCGPVAPRAIGICCLRADAAGLVR
jgi:hypothetical protein